MADRRRGCRRARCCASGNATRPAQARACHRLRRASVRVLAAERGGRPQRSGRGTAPADRRDGPERTGSESRRGDRSSTGVRGERDRMSNTLNDQADQVWSAEADLADDVLIRVDNLVKYFPVQGGGLLRRTVAQVQAVDGVSLTVRRGQTLGLVGETGCGKSTLARCIAGLIPATSGKVYFEGKDITNLSRHAMQPFRREIQMIFQDPYGSLNPRRRVGAIIGDPYAVHKTATGTERKKAVQDLMARVGLNPEHFNRFPAEFSGGQRQRIGVARALALRPKLIICDEPASALDVSIQAQVLTLLSDLQQDFGLSYLFIAHDLEVVRHVSDSVIVMYLGQIAEAGPKDQVYDTARHPYTAALLSAAPAADPDAAASRRRIILTGDVPSPINPPSGCRFHPRCPKAQELCGQQEPLLESKLGDPATHQTACHFPVEAGESLARVAGRDRR